MASSGSFNTTSSHGRYLTFSWSIKSQDAATNKTVINWSLKGGGDSGYVVCGNFKVVVNGSTVYSSSTRINVYNTTTVASGTATIAHNTDGTKTFSASAEAGIYNIAVNCRGSGSWAINAIPRYATVSQSMSAKTETTITMKWTSDSTIDYIWYSTNNGSSWTGINVADGKSGTYTISGRAANTTYQIRTRVRRKDSQLTTDSSALSVTTYAYPYASGMPNFTIGNKLTLTLYNPLGRSVTVNIIGADNSQCSADTTTGTSISGYNGTAVVNALYASIPNAQSGTYKVKVTYGSQVSTKSGGTYTVNKTACAPSIGSVAYQDTNSTVVGITENNQKIVRNQSTVRYTASSLSAQKSATVTSCKVVVNGTTYNLTLSGSSATGGNAAINSGTNVSAVFTVTDSRGLTASKSITVQMLDWQTPTAVTTLARENNYYSTTYITVDADYSSVNGKNTITITYKAKKRGTSSWTVNGTLQDNVQSSFTADNNYAWDVQVIVTDRFGGTTTYNIVLSRGMPIIYFDRLKSSVGINCFPKDDQSLEVNGVNVSKNIMTRSLSAAMTSLAVNTYTIIPLDLSISVGNKLTATNDGGILIGANVTKVMVSASLSYDVTSSTGTRHFRIIKNDSTAANTLAWGWNTLVQSQPCKIDILPVIGNVTEGDVIYICYYTPNANDKIGGNTYGKRTSLTVEVVG